MFRVGIGYDVHRLVEGRKLFLGGVEIPWGKGLEGHSDADVLIHAVCDALLGAIGEGDIGQHFPNTEERWRDVRSTVFLKDIAEKLRKRKVQVANIDASLAAEAPKIGPYLSAMKESMAEALGIEPHQIGVKATTNERLGFVGRGEGIAAMAVACVEGKG